MRVCVNRPSTRCGAASHPEPSWREAAAVRGLAVVRAGVRRWLGCAVRVLDAPGSVVHSPQPPASGLAPASAGVAGAPRCMCLSSQPAHRGSPTWARSPGLALTWARPPGRGRTCLQSSKGRSARGFQAHARAASANSDHRPEPAAWPPRSQEAPRLGAARGNGVEEAGEGLLFPTL